MTLKEFYENVAKGNTNKEIMEKALDQLTKLNKRNEKRNAENAPLLEEMQEILTDAEPLTAGEIKPLLSEGKYPIQKVSALLRIMRENGEVKIVPVKRTGKSAQNAYVLLEEEEEV